MKPSLMFFTWQMYCFQISLYTFIYILLRYANLKISHIIIDTTLCHYPHVHLTTHKLEVNLRKLKHRSA